MPEVIILPIFFICATYMVVSIARVIQRSRREARIAEVTTRLVDRLGNGQDVASFMSSEAFRSLMAEPTAESGLRSRILNSIQGGAVLVANGLALLGTESWLSSGVGHNLNGVAGVVLVAVGAALLLSAAVSNYLVSRWRVLQA